MMSSLWAILAMIYALWTTIKGDYASAIYSTIIFGVGVIICFLVNKLYEKLSLVFMFALNILCSVIPVLGAFFSSEFKDCN